MTRDSGEDADPYNAFINAFELIGDTGPLDDLTMTLKDNIAVAGVPMTGGPSVFTESLEREQPD